MLRWYTVRVYFDVAMQAELQYKKREKKIAPTGWEAFNQKALYEAYEKRTSDIPYTQEVSTHLDWVAWGFCTKAFRLSLTGFI